ncbi:ATP-dependent protease [bacterium]|nr:ATP-dependent protease [Chloroflexi bacterium CFX6]RIL10920.1 MAG: ATP-dependent protease [bacterium]
MTIPHPDGRTAAPDETVSLPADALCSACDAKQFEWSTTVELEPLDQVIGQDRAVEAVRFGIEIQRLGFNVFAHGPAGSGKSTTVGHVLDVAARHRPVPDDWCYVSNFDSPHQPIALRLPPGGGARLRDALGQAVEGLLVALPTLFESDAYAVRRDALADDFQARSQANFERLRAAAAERQIGVIQGDDGISIAPLDGDEIMRPEAFQALEPARRTAIEARLAETQSDLEAAARAEQAIQREAEAATAALEQAAARVEVDARLSTVRTAFEDAPDVVRFLEAVGKDVLDRLDLFRRPEAEAPASDDEAANGGGAPVRGDLMAVARVRWRTDPRLRRYKVNVLIDHGGATAAPVIVERYPTLASLVGRIEHEQRFGALVTDFTLIKPGALHRANGGFLVIEADELFKQPRSWDALKRAVRHGEIRFEAQQDESSPMTTIMLDPAPIPLACKVVLIGNSDLYFSLYALDADFPELFKVGAEFAASMPRTRQNVDLYARMIATIGMREDLLPFHRTAVARIIEHAARLAEDAQRLSTYFLDVADLVREADFWSRQSAGAHVERRHVERAIDARVERADLARDRVLESYARRIVLVDVSGEAVGQVNGLSVMTRGNFSFGVPMRITARVRMGAGEVVDIAREVELGGPVHSKGVLTLAGFLAGRYLPDDDLAVAASLTFEQSYTAVDGDSASSAELYALLSALSGVPLRQSLAVTGSMNQTGEVQAIGGVNEKIEGYFDVCQQHGLTGDQGVLIPAANAQHLMLRHDVVAAVRAGQFHVYPVRQVDAGIALLTGLPAGARDRRGRFPAGSVNRLVEDRLARFARRQRRRPDGA